jgi:hypothetical protein
LAARDCSHGQDLEATEQMPKVRRGDPGPETNRCSSGAEGKEVVRKGVVRLR